ncbi:uncharacterized protein PFLUO_LOCUS5270 [Penicillium psychrofluorescens]|uniref:uncharacterized protein n=1 Tax=Penicillium psychrofluorescens TaxID=3158075 RepID=UPI003CCE1768
MYLVARFLTGIATGQTVVAMPVYFAEIASPSSRGLMAGAHGSFINVGYAISNWVGYGCFLLGRFSFLRVLAGSAVVLGTKKPCRSCVDFTINPMTHKVASLIKS